MHMHHMILISKLIKNQVIYHFFFRLETDVAHWLVSLGDQCFVHQCVIEEKLWEDSSINSIKSYKCKIVNKDALRKWIWHCHRHSLWWLTQSRTRLTRLTAHISLIEQTMALYSVCIFYSDTVEYSENNVSVFIRIIFIGIKHLLNVLSLRLCLASQEVTMSLRPIVCL